MPEGDRIEIINMVSQFAAYGLRAWALPANFDDPNSRWIIGNGLGGDFAHPGLIDDFTIFAGALSGEQIEAMAHRPRAANAPSDPDLSVDRLVDLGSQRFDSRGDHRVAFTIANGGASRDLEIASVGIVGGHRQHFRVSAFPSSIAPGSEGEIVLVFERRFRTGEFRILLELLTNDPDLGGQAWIVPVVLTVPDPSGPMARYTMDDRGSILHDVSGFRRHGEYREFQGGLRFGEPGARLETGFSTHFSGGGSAVVPWNRLESPESLTVMFWMKTLRPHTGVLFSRIQDDLFGNNRTEFSIALLESNLHLMVANRGSVRFPEPVQMNQWHCVALVHDSDQRRATVYLDGREMGSLEVDRLTPRASFYLGAITGGRVGFSGWIDDVVVFDRALSPFEMEFLAQNTLPVDSISLELTKDSDGDGLKDAAETNIYRTDPMDPDSDGDGLNDGDELSVHGTDPSSRDSDGDGLPDGAETVARTSPTDGADVFTIMDMDHDPNGIRIVWSSVPGVTYTIEYSADLSSGSWERLGTVVAAGDSTDWRGGVARPEARYYRIRVSR